MHRTVTGGWLVTPRRVLVTDGASWRDCLLMGDITAQGMPLLKAVFVDGAIHVWVGSTLWTSADGCASWSEAEVPDGPLDMAFPTANVGYFLSSPQPVEQNPSATIFKTQDGGLYWTATVTVGVSSSMAVDPTVSFADTDHGWVTDGATVWTTANGGSSWSTTSLPHPGSLAGGLGTLTESAAGADGSAVIAANYDVTHGQGGLPCGGALCQEVFYRTVDFGAHWTVASIVEDREIVQVSLVDSKTWVVLDPSEASAIRTTTDAGATWQTTAVRQRWPSGAVWLPTRSGIDFADTLRGWLVVSEPEPVPTTLSWGPPQPAPQHLVVTNDGGATWTELTP